MLSPPTLVSGGETHAITDEVRRDIACPRCEYNLRGLHGAVVTCPECGEVCDIAELVQRRWTKPWWKAPNFNTILMPAAWFYVTILGVGCFGQAARAVVGTLAMLIVAMGVWGFLFHQAWRVFRSQRGVWLALLAHALIVGYFLAIGAILIAVFLSIDHWTDPAGDEWVAGGILAAGLFVTVLLGWLCRRGEKYIAGQCIRRYLAKPPKA